MRELCGGIFVDSCEQATLEEGVVEEWIFFEGEDAKEVARAFTCAEEPVQRVLEPFEFHAEAVKQGVPYIVNRFVYPMDLERNPVGSQSSDS